MNSNSRTMIIAIIGGLIALCLCLVILGAAGFLFFQTSRSETTVEGAPAVEYILDVSARMNLPAQGSPATRLEIARGALAEMTRAAPDDGQAALRVFGSGAQPAACQDTALLLPLAAGNQARIASELSGLQPGDAPQAALVEAMIAAIRNLAGGDGPRALVVITGGQDDCQAEAARLAAEEATRAGIELRTFVIGFQVPTEQQTAVKALAESAGAGVYLNAQDEEELRQALAAVRQYLETPDAVAFAAVQTVAQSLADSSAAQPTPESATAAAVTPDATAIPAPESTPTPSPTPPPDMTATAVASGDQVGETACDHPYFPLRPGATWTYTGDVGGESITWVWTVTEVVGDRNNATATVEAEFSNFFSSTYTWGCGPEGIFAFDYGNFAFAEMGFEMEEMSFSTEIVESEGATLPAPQALAPGASWNSSFTMRTSVSVAGFSFVMDTVSSSSYAATSVEAVSVPAGAFDALRVEMVGSVTTANSLMPGDLESFSSSGTNWYARGVGWLRMVTIEDGERAEWELVSYSIPQR